ncbi:MAG TPA: ABC transporter permease [Longimicrobiaceae bacterium]|jgi:phospholipid/cholesterol/gamma-HCH transport system permease protein|nr:ABC transporter permease [Longimicrobiaceae bacterium]
MKRRTVVLLRPVAALGSAVLDFIASFGRFGGFVINSVRAVGDVGTWLPGLFLQMRRLGVDSLPIAVFLAAFTGIVLALQASYTFTGAIPLYFVGTLVGKTMILELGPVLTGLALSGRVGANIAAQLGTMRVTEQIDALETMAYDPMAYLVVPRVIAGMIMFPLLVIFADAVGIIAGWITSINLLDMSSEEFFRGLKLFYQLFDIEFSLIKTFSFGFLVTIVGCFQGFTTEGGAEGVGISATRAVVIGSMLILVFDAFWAMVLLR